MLPEIAHQMGLVPLAWLLWLRWRGIRRGPEWWWVAAAFGISWLADTVVHLWGHPWLVSAVYPVSQTAVIGAVFLPRHISALLTMILVGVGVVAVLSEGIDAPHLLLHATGWSAIVGVLWDRPASPLRTALLLAFGVNLGPWVAFALWPSWGTWEVYQGVRALSLGWFCWAAAQPGSAHVAA